MNLMVLRATTNYLVVLVRIKNVGPNFSTWFFVEICLTCLVVPLRCCQLAFELGVTFSLVPILPRLLWWGMSTSVYDPLGTKIYGSPTKWFTFVLWIKSIEFKNM